MGQDRPVSLNFLLGWRTDVPDSIEAVVHEGAPSGERHPVLALLSRGETQQSRPRNTTPCLLSSPSTHGARMDDELLLRNRSSIVSLRESDTPQTVP